MNVHLFVRIVNVASNDATVPRRTRLQRKQHTISPFGMPVRDVSPLAQVRPGRPQRYAFQSVDLDLADYVGAVVERVSRSPG